MFVKDIEKFIKQIDNEIELSFEKDMQRFGLACEPTLAKIFVGIRTSPEEEKAFTDYVNELEPNFFEKYKVNTYVMALLHEVGHIMTHIEDLEEEYNKDTKLLETLEDNGKLTKEQQCYFYARLELETLATQWAIDFVKENYNFVNNSQNDIIKRLVA